MATYYVYADEAARQAAIQAGKAAENNSFTSIQTAINQSAAGDTIQVGAGTFDEKIMVDKAVTLQGVSGHAAIITNGFEILADDVTIAGFTIQPVTVNYGSSACGIIRGSSMFGGDAVMDRLTVKDNVFDCSQSSGPNAYGLNMTVGGDSADVIITGNQFIGAAGDGTKKGQDAFYGGKIENFVFDNNTIDGFKHHGVSVTELSGDSSISNNRITGVARNGIQVDGPCAGSVGIAGNVIDGALGSSDDDGALVLRNANADASNPADIRVSGNVIINSTTGIYLEKDSLDSDVAITGNVIDGNVTDIKSNSAADITLSGNCYGSAEPVVQAPGGGKVVAGDSVPVEADGAVVCVSSLWTGLAAGVPVPAGNGKFYTLGTDAFSSIAGATAACREEQKVVVIGGTYGSDDREYFRGIGTEIAGTADSPAVFSNETFGGSTGDTLVGGTDVTIGDYVTNSDWFLGGSYGAAAVDTVIDGNTKITVTADASHSSFLAIFGGNRGLGRQNQLSSTAITGTAQLSIAGGRFDATIDGYVGAVGGSYLPWFSTDTIGATLVDITGGTFNQYANIVGGSYVQGGVGTAEVIGSVTVNVSNANSEGKIIGGGLYYGQTSGTLEHTVTGDVALTVDGATRAAMIIGGNALVADGTAYKIKEDGTRHYMNQYVTGELTMTIGGTVRTVIGKDVTVSGDVIGGSYLLGTQYLGGSAPVYCVKPGSVTIDKLGKIELNINGSTVQGNVYGGTYVNDEWTAGGGTLTAEAESVDLIITGGNIAGNIYGGGANGGNVTGNVTVTLTDTTADYIHGGGNAASVGGEIKLTVEGGEAKRIYGGGVARDGGSADASKIVMNISGKAGDVIGGGWVNNTTTAPAADSTARINAGSVEINIKDNAEVGSVYGGVQTYHYSAGGYHKWADAVVDETTINITGGNVKYFVAAGGRGGHGSGTADSALEYRDHVNTVKVGNINITGGTVGNVMGGGVSTGEYNSVHVETANIAISGGAVSGDVYGGGYDGWGETAHKINTVGTTNITISGDALIEGNVYAGGYFDASDNKSGTPLAGNKVEVENAYVTITGGRVGGDVILGGSSVAAPADGSTVGDIRFSITGGEIGGNIEAGYVTGNIAITVSGGNIAGDIYAGSSNGGLVFGDVTITIENQAELGSDIYTLGSSAGADNGVSITVAGNLGGSIYAADRQADVITLRDGAVFTGTLNLDSSDTVIFELGMAGITLGGGVFNLSGATLKLVKAPEALRSRAMPEATDISSVLAMFTGIGTLEVTFDALVGASGSAGLQSALNEIDTITVGNGSTVFFDSEAAAALANLHTITGDGTVILPEPPAGTKLEVAAGSGAELVIGGGADSGIVIGAGGSVQADANGKLEVGGSNIAINGIPEGTTVEIASGATDVVISPDVDQSKISGDVSGVKIAVNWPADFFGADAPASAEQLVPAADRATFGTGNDAVVNFTSDYTLYGTAAQASDADAKTWLYVQNSTIRNGVFGGSLAGRVGTSNIYVQDSSISAVYGGGQSFQALDGTFTGSTTGTANVYVAGGEIGEVFGGADGVGSTVGTANVMIAGGTVRSVYGGGVNGASTVTSNVTITGSADVTTAYAGGLSSDVENATLTISGPDVQVYKVYGGGSLASTVCNSVLKIENGATVNYVYGGGDSNGHNVTGSMNVTVSDSTVSNVLYGIGRSCLSCDGTVNVTNSDIAMFYVGTYSKDGSGVNHITGTLTANLTDSRIGNQLIVAGRLGGTRDMSVTIHEVIVNAANSNLGSGNVMLGGFIENEGADLATGKHTLTVDRVEFNATAGTVMQHFYAGGRADNGVLTVKEAVISLENSTSGNIYGGGYSEGCGKNIVENVTITVGTGSTVRNVIAGGHNAGSTVENATVEIAGGTVQYSVYGGGNNAAVENATVILSGGAVAGDVKAGNVAGSQSVGSAQVVFKGSAYTSVAGTVSGAGADRSTLVFDAFTGNLDLKVQGFTGVEVRSGSKVTFGDNVDLSTVNSLAITIDAAPAEALVSFGDKLNALNELAVTVGTLAAGNWILASGVTLASGAVITLNNTAVAIGAEMILLPGDMLGQLLLVDGNLSINVKAAPQPTLDHIAVSPAYTTADETFTLNGEFYKVGTNAFSTLSEAVSAAEENSVLTVAGANYGSAALNINASQTWKAGDDAAIAGLATINIADGVTWNNLAAIDIAAGSTLKLYDSNNTNTANDGTWREYTLNGKITGGGRLEYMSSQTNATTSLILGDGLYADAADGASIAVGARRLYLNGNGANVTVVSYAPNMILDGIWGGCAVAGAAINQDLTVKVDGVGFSGATDGIYGGGRDADITGNIRVELANIPGGGAKINVFGGNVTDSGAGDRGVINGDISSTITASAVGNVYGGSENSGSMTGNTSVTLTNSTAGAVYGGGGGTFAVNGNTSVTLTGSTVGTATSAGTVYAGAMQTDGKVTETATLVVTDSTIYGRIGGSNGSVGRTSITLNGNTVVGGDRVYVESMASSVFGGTVDERGGAGSTFISVGGNTRLLGSAFQTGTAGGNLYGGSRQYSWVTGDTEVEIKDNASIAGSVFGGGIGDGYKGNDGVGGNTSITVSGSAEVAGDIYGGGETSNGDDGGYSVKGNTEITIRDNASVHSIYAGGKAGTVGGTGTITVCGGTFAAGSVIDGANVAGGTTLNLENVASVADVTFRNLALVNVKQDMAYSLNRFVNVAEISISAGKTLTLDAANADVTLGSDVTGDGKFVITNGKTVYAAGRNITLSDSSVNMIAGATYSPGAGNSKDFAETNLTLNNVTAASSVYGGSYYTDHVGTANLTINGGTYNGRVVGGSTCDDYNENIVVDRTNVVITAGTFKQEVYGGGNAASTVKAGSSLTISGGTFSNSVFGGGSGRSVVGDWELVDGIAVEKAGSPKADSSLTITGGTFNTNGATGGVYGGNAHGFVTGNASVTITGDGKVSIRGPVVGGNNASSPSGRAANYIGGNTYVTIENANAVIAGHVFGGSSSQKYDEAGGSATLVKGDSHVTITAGTVQSASGSTGRVYGGGCGIEGGLSVVEGTAYVTIGTEGVADAEDKLNVQNVYGSGNSYSSVGNAVVEIHDSVNRAYLADENAVIKGTASMTVTADIRNGVAAVLGGAKIGTATTGVNTTEIVTVKISGDQSCFHVMGSGNGAAVYGSMGLYLDGANLLLANDTSPAWSELLVGGFYGESTGEVFGDALVSIANSTIATKNTSKKGNIVGAGGGTVHGTSRVMIGDNVDLVCKDIAAGPSWKGSAGNSELVIDGANTSVTATSISGGAFGSGSTVLGDSSVTINAGTVKATTINAAGRSGYGTVGGNATVTINGGSITSTIISGGRPTVSGISSFIFNDAAAFEVSSISAFDVVEINKNAMTFKNLSNIGEIRFGAGVTEVAFNNVTFDGESNTLDLTGLQVSAAKISMGAGDDVLKLGTGSKLTGTVGLGAGKNTLSIVNGADYSGATFSGVTRLEVGAGATGTMAIDNLVGGVEELCISLDGRSYDSTEAAVSVTGALDSSLSISIEVPAVWGGAESAKEIILIKNLTGSTGGLGVDGMTITVFGKLGKISSELGSAQVGGAATVDFGMGANWGLKLNGNGDLVFYNDMPQTMAAFNEPSIASAMNCLATENIVSGCGSTLDALNLNLDADDKKQLA